MSAVHMVPEVEPPHPLGSEDEVAAVAARLPHATACRLWAAYDGWSWAPVAEREWAALVMGVEGRLIVGQEQR